MSSTTTVKKPEDLTEIVIEIAQEHKLLRDPPDVPDALEHAFAIGELLLQAKKMVEYGRWEPWLATQAISWSMTLQSARSYMQLARYREEITAEKLTSLKAARRFLRKKVEVRDVRFDPKLRSEAERLFREEGKTRLEIADTLGVAKSTVTRWLNPEGEKKYREARARTSRAGRLSERSKERKDAAKAVGGELGKGYKLLRQTMETLLLAAAEAEGEERRLIRSGINSLYNSEDAVARAMKIKLQGKKP